MDNFDPRNPVLLHEISSAERGEFSLLALNGILDLLDEEESLICHEAYAIAGPVWTEYPSILNQASGAVLLADVVKRAHSFSINWYWDYSNLFDDELDPSRPTKLPPLPHSVFRYPKRVFNSLEEPIRSQVIQIEIAFSSLRKRFARLAAIREQLVKYKGSVERGLRKEAMSARQSSE